MGFTHKKQFGQNFLVNSQYCLKFIDAACVTKEDKVIEVGPGDGALTQYLVNEAGKVIAIEVDKALSDRLIQRFKNFLNLKVINRDILTVDPAEFELEPFKYVLLGSLPYNISKQIIRKFFEADIKPSKMILVIQKEVALEYATVPPRATYLSNYANYFARVELLDFVPKDCFSPVPKVDGAIIRFTLKKEQDTTDYKFLKFLKSSFQNPRKKLINNLSGIYKMDKTKMGSIFGKVGLNPNARASNLILSEWKKLQESLSLTEKYES